MRYTVWPRLSRIAVELGLFCTGVTTALVSHVNGQLLVEFTPVSRLMLQSMSY